MPVDDRPLPYLRDAFAARDLEVVAHLAHDAYRLRRRGSGEALVLRLLPWHLGWTADLLEARGPALCALDHPGIARALEIAEALGDEPRCHLLREHVPGVDARVDGALPVDLAVYVAVKITEALAAARPTIGPHRRLSPAHVLLSVDGEVKVIGFEDAYVDRRVEASGPIRRHGWLSYISPEEILQRGGDGRCDVFSLGACLWTWLSGHPPFRPRPGSGSRDFAALHAILQDTSPPLAELRPELPAGLVATVTRALAKDPDARFAGVEAMGAALRDALDCDPDLARHALAAWVGADAAAY